MDDKDKVHDTVETESTETREAAILSPSSSSLSADETRRSSQTSVTTSSIKYPPPQVKYSESDAASMVSYASSSSRKARPESMLVEPPIGPIVPGIALVDFNHLVGPKIEFCDGSVFDDEQIAAILPFLALPDGAHLSSEDYSYFHLVPASPHPSTIFGISCNRQIKTSDLLAKDDDVTRSTVQKAVVVLASKPVFGPIRDRLGVVTQALFSQRDFRETGILVDFKSSLEMSLRNQLTESAMYMGTSLRELVHKFRSRTLLLLKSLMLQKRIMFYGHPVERLCTYQYSLISLIPGLLQNLDDCGSPPLASRALTLLPATSLRTSDRKSLMAYLGLPLDVFGKDAFFQPYLPLQQVDLIKDTRSYVCGSTNSIVTQQKEIDLLINIETNTFEFRDPQLERLVALTSADRKWMDDIVKDVNEGWDETNPSKSTSVQFKGSDDYIRTKFEEYVTAALSSVKYADFLTKSSRSDVVVTGGDGGDANAIQDFNPQWIAEFRRTNAFEVWNRVTDPMIFDIVEARHPCSGKPSVVEDIGLRLQEGLQDLHLQEQLAPTREAISRTFATSSTNFLKAVEGVRGRWAQRSSSSLSASEGETSTISSTPVEVSRSEVDLAKANGGDGGETTNGMTTRSSTLPTTPSQTGLRPLSLSTGPAQSIASDAKTAIGSWGSSIGSFISQRTARLSVPRTNSVTSAGSQSTSSTSVFSTDGSLVSSPAEIQDPITAQERVGNGTNWTNGTAEAGESTPASTPLTSLFSSWSFGKATASTTTSPPPVSAPTTAPDQGLAAKLAATNGDVQVQDLDFQPRDLGDFEPPKSSNSSIRNSESVETGMAL
ncbi:uncharacterized protein FOMMEDRAFT_114559 [Fomitiporia mediterranea MF3/22]|uniref:uncharacterized protein n=1 Tax=Fomitiporia mediterranea (strain MF3/22) TaxID=694068 RepID=UPI0004407B53|nr:uncharacterized protein FOMMEDRAFT_114559 [Fomitiporia mediterranea MF3/22]EJC97833.1 hypothetical protein FOMMEDRAFT_114559 [Fomitiporia mediterranea MF3/22]